ncbi:MerR family transcriptional regulator [Micromonospora sp. ZYX-F-536]|uniref:MerR family transcriptional regulator n=1 Tax=Micromonospora sp. ZYX-F-536 TaxID=3457629 RepID=UPI004040A3EE
MRISDLSRQTGVPVATIKFYLREGLLPPGRPTARNQAQYDEVHRRRLSMIRTLTSLGQLELSAVRELLRALEDEGRCLPELFAMVSRALPPVDTAKDQAETSTEQARVTAFIDSLGWKVEPDASARAILSQVLAAMDRLNCGQGVEFFEPYAKAAEQHASRELDLLGKRDEGCDRASAIVRAILVDVANTALRRMAYEHLVKQRFAGGPSGG